MQKLFAGKYRWIPLLMGELILNVLLSQHSDRSDFLTFSLLFLSLALLFLGMAYSLWVNNDQVLPKILVIGLLLRLAWIPELPELSDDYFRFIWDGHTVEQGINPYAFTPEQMRVNKVFPKSEYVDKLYLNLNSPQYFSIYPPINQSIFWISTHFSVDNIWIAVLILRLFLLSIELMGFYFMVKLFDSLQLGKLQAYWYWCNPLVIIEGVGNLHFEVIAVSFLAGGIYYLHRNKTGLSALYWSLSIATKLLPLMWLPYLIKYSGLKQGWKIGSLILLLCLLIFSPVIFPGYVGNFFSSLDLYFHSFEFNASLYYLERNLGYLIWDYNNIALIGTLNFFLVLVIFAFLFFRKTKAGIQGLLELMLLSLSAYLAFSTTIHPWYIIPLLFLGISTQMYFPLLWSLLAFLSYEAYSHFPVKENPTLLFLEYLPVYLYALYEFFQFRFSTRTRAISPD